MFTLSNIYFQKTVDAYGKLEGGKLSPDVVFSSVRDIGIEKSTGSSLNVYLKSYP